jgi:hypothetical protein
MNVKAGVFPGMNTLLSKFKRIAGRRIVYNERRAAYSLARTRFYRAPVKNKLRERGFAAKKPRLTRFLVVKTKFDYAQVTLPRGSWKTISRKKRTAFSRPSREVMRLSSCSTESVPS